MSQNPVQLKIEQFYNDEDTEFRIKSKREMLSILQNLAHLGTRTALFYGSGKSFILSTLLSVNENGMWMDVGPFPPENKQILSSRKITFVSSHQNVKIQFEVPEIRNSTYENNEAFYLAMPEYMLRIQRREYFRTPIPSIPVVRCIIPIHPENPDDPVIMRAVPLIDISGGGVGLLCGEHEATLLPEKIFTDCKITLPDSGVIKVTIEVKNGINFSTRKDVMQKRVGCHFLDLDSETKIILQRYINRLQSESLIKP